MGATYWTTIASLLFVFQTGSTNQLLLVPLFGWHGRLNRLPYGRLMVVVIISLLVILPGLLFLATRSGNVESATWFLPLPLLTLLVLIGFKAQDWQTAHCSVTPGKGRAR
jgi:hypothetical protein